LNDANPISRNTTWLYTPAILTVLLDQATKFIARATLIPDRGVTVIPGFFDLRLSYNMGAAFGRLPGWTPLFIILALACIFAIVKLKGAASGSRGLMIGLGLLMGGAIGNLLDRIFSPTHEVTDFLSFHINYNGKVQAWPTFNIADSAIVVGAIMVMLFVYVVEKRRS
jgi:signal peptidase II